MIIRNNQPKHIGEERRYATFSDCLNYRYFLDIFWDAELPTLQAIGLNPSTADEMRDDHTVRKLKKLARKWGYGSLCMTNLFAFRATEPKVMKAQADPVGDANMASLLAAGKRASTILCAWGNHGSHRMQSTTVLAELRRHFPEKLHYLRLTKQQQPEHPLYIPESTPLSRLV